MSPLDPPLGLIPSWASNAASLIERLRLAEIVTTTVMFAELGEWDRYAERYANEITIDYSPSIGSGPQVLTREAMVVLSRSSIEAFDASQHQVTNPQVDLEGDTARVRSYLRATHRIGNDIWVCGGIYIHRLERSSGSDWRITHQQRIALYEQGDRTVFERAAVKMKEVRLDLGSLSLKGRELARS